MTDTVGFVASAMNDITPIITVTASNYDVVNQGGLALNGHSMWFIGSSIEMLQKRFGAMGRYTIAHDGHGRPTDAFNRPYIKTCYKE